MLRGMRRSFVFLGVAITLSFLAGPAQAVPFAAPAQVERFEISGGAVFVDEFDNGIFPEAPWFLLCGSASESGGALSVDTTGTSPFCPLPIFAAGPTLSFTTDTTVTADIRAVLPAEGEGIAIRVGTFDVGDFIDFGTLRLGGQIFLGVRDENGAQAAIPVDPVNFPSSFYTIQIALALDVPSGILVPTISASSDGNPFLSQVLAPIFGLDTNALGAGEQYATAIIAGPVPEPGSAVLLLAGLLGMAAVRGRGGVRR